MGGTKGPSTKYRGKSSNSPGFSFHTGGDDEAVVVYSGEGEGSPAEDLSSAEGLPESAAALAADIAAAAGALGTPSCASPEASSSSLGDGSRAVPGGVYASSAYAGTGGGGSPGTGNGSPGTGGTPGGSPGDGSGPRGGDPGASSASFASSRRSHMARSRSGRQQSGAERPPVFRSWKEREHTNSTPGSPGCTTGTSTSASQHMSAAVSGPGKGRAPAAPRLCSTLGTPGELTSSGLAAADLARWAAEGNMWGPAAGAGTGAGRHSGGFSQAESEKEARLSPWRTANGDHSSEGSPPVSCVPPTGRGGPTGGAPPKGTSLLTKLSSIKGLKGSIAAISDAKKRAQGASRRTMSDGGDGTFGESPSGPPGEAGAGAGAGAPGVPGTHQGRKGGGSPPPGSARLASRSRSISSSEAAAAYAARASPSSGASLLSRDRSFSNRRSSDGSGNREALAIEVPPKGAHARAHILRSASQDHSAMGLHGRDQDHEASDSPWAQKRRIKDKAFFDAASSSDSPGAHPRRAKDPASPGDAHRTPPFPPPASGRPPAIPLPCTPPLHPSAHPGTADAHPSRTSEGLPTAAEARGEPAARPRAASAGRPERWEGASGGKDSSATATTGSTPAAGTLSARQQLSTEDRIKLWEEEKEREKEGGGARGKARAHRGSSAHRERRGEGGAGAQAQERGNSGAQRGTTALGCTASAPPGPENGSDVSSEVRCAMGCQMCPASRRLHRTAL